MRNSRKILFTVMAQPALSRLLVLFALPSLVTGCVVMPPEPIVGDPQYAPVIVRTPDLPPPSPGSLYRSGFGLSLYNDEKASQVGDLITIVLTERTVSSKSASSTLSKSSELEFDAGPLLGTNPSFKNLSLDTDVETTRDFTGDADADQSNRLEGNISVTVSEVLPNGNLLVRGEKWLTLNHGDEFIRISGIVRQADVGQDNSVESTKLANARITYSGRGDLADTSKQGWLTRFFNSAYWPL